MFSVAGLIFSSTASLSSVAVSFPLLSVAVVPLITMTYCAVNVPSELTVAGEEPATVSVSEYSPTLVPVADTVGSVPPLTAVPLIVSVTPLGSAERATVSPATLAVTVY